MPSEKPRRNYGAKTRPVDLSAYFNFPRRIPKGEWWRELAAKLRAYPTGSQKPWGIPFRMGEADGLRAVSVAKGKPEITIDLGGKADFVCVLHQWYQIPKTRDWDHRAEGLVVAEYELLYADESTHIQPVRASFEVFMDERAAPPWLAVPFNMHHSVDPANHPQWMRWGESQPGLRLWWGEPHVYAMQNPHPERKIVSFTVRGMQESPLMIAGITLYQGSAHPLAHLPRRTYGLDTGGSPAKVADAEVDLGGVARIEHTQTPRDKEWLNSPHAGVNSPEPDRGEDVLEIFGAPDATVSVVLEGAKKPLRFSLGEAFHEGESTSGEARLKVLGQRRQWMRVRVIDTSTGKPTPVRIHLSGSRGEYIAPHGHHAQVNANWFEDYGADVVFGGRSYAYVHGEFTTDLPVGNLFVEINKGFEYQPVRRKVTIRPGQKTLDLEVSRWKDLRSEGWVTADTHVHFISPHTAWLEAQAEGVNVVNLLASQWGRLFTNVGDLTGRVGINENDTIVYVGTENRNHMLGHMSMLGTQGSPVYPMCCGGPSEAYVGDPDFMTLAEWAAENRRKGGVVIRPHFPWCGGTEDPVPILKGLVDALEIWPHGFPVQEWYRYLNCGYRVAVASGTDKMSAGTALGNLRTYARIDTGEPFTYENWASAVRAGRTISTNGPLIDLTVEGREIGSSIQLPPDGGAMEVHSTAESAWPIGRLEIVCNGQVVASEQAAKGARVLHVRDKIAVRGSGWIAARCYGVDGHPGSYHAAHTSPVYVKCGETRAFDGPAMEHMLALVEGGIEYLNTLATVYDEPSRKRMTKLFSEARKELKGRLVVEGKHVHHHGDGVCHTHGRGVTPGHQH